MKKKLLAILLSAFMLFGIMACNDNGGNDGDDFTEVTGATKQTVYGELVAALLTIGTDSAWSKYEYSGTGTENYAFGDETGSITVSTTGKVIRGESFQGLHEEVYTGTESGGYYEYIKDGRCYAKHVEGTETDKYSWVAEASDIDYFGSSFIRTFFNDAEYLTEMFNEYFKIDEAKLYQSASSTPKTIKLVMTENDAEEGRTETMTLEASINASGKVTLLKFSDQYSYAGDDGTSTYTNVETCKPFSGTITFPTDLNTYPGVNEPDDEEDDLLQEILDAIDEVYSWNHYEFLISQIEMTIEEVITSNILVMGLYDDSGATTEAKFARMTLEGEDTLIYMENEYLKEGTYYYDYDDQDGDTAKTKHTNANESIGLDYLLNGYNFSDYAGMIANADISEETVENRTITATFMDMNLTEMIMIMIMVEFDGDDVASLSVNIMNMSALGVTNNMMVYTATDSTVEYPMDLNTYVEAA